LAGINQLLSSFIIHEERQIPIKCRRVLFSVR
jgi:hypothetical protein